MTTQTYQEISISLSNAAKKYGIPKQTLSRWAEKGRLKILQRPELRGQALLVDEASVVLAMQQYRPHITPGRQFQPAMPENHQALEVPPVPQEYPTSELIEAFNQYNRRLAPDTLSGYYYRLKVFLKHFPMLPLSPEPIQDFIDSIPGTDANRHTSATVLRTFYRWAYKLHHLPKEIENPIDLVKFPPDGRRGKLPRVLSDEEALKVINAGRSFKEKTMLRLLWTSGLRAGELRSLKEDMLHPPDTAIPQPSIRPSGKMGERKVWITATLYDDLLTIVASQESEYIFTDRYGDKLDSSGLYQRVQRCMIDAGIKGKKRGPYAFRHTFVTNIIADSGDVMLAKELAGHTRISTTEKYTHLAAKHIAQGFDKFNPERRLLNEELAEKPKLTRYRLFHRTKKVFRDVEARSGDEACQDEGWSIADVWVRVETQGKFANGWKNITSRKGEDNDKSVS